MIRLLRSNVTIVWFVLVTMTAASWWIGKGPWEDQAVRWAPASSLMLVLAFVKAHLVIRHFMEVRSAPVVLRCACDLWVLITLGGSGYVLALRAMLVEVHGS